ncbi:MAG: hypothetical protein ACPG7F_19150 [Aggregatilineales bacterium]
MAILNISESLLKRLERIAQKRNSNVETLLEGFAGDATIEAEEQSISMGETAFDPENPPPGTGAALVKAMLESNVSTDEVVDTSERSHEILETEFRDYVPGRNSGVSNESDKSA